MKVIFKILRLKAQEMLTFEYFQSLEIELNYKKLVWMEIQLANYFTLGPMILATLID